MFRCESETQHDEDRIEAADRPEPALEPPEPAPEPAPEAPGEPY